MDHLADSYEGVVGMAYSVDLERAGERLSVGMSAQGWMITRFDSDGTGLNAVGDRLAEGDIEFWFGDVSVVSRKYLMPRDAALRVIRQWCDTGTLAEDVAWTYEVF